MHEPRLQLAWNELDEDKRNEKFINSFKLSGLVNNDTSVIEAFDNRMEPNYTSDIIPVAMKRMAVIEAVVK